MRESLQPIEAEQAESGTAPDHERALPAERAGEIALAAPGDEECWVVLTSHHYDRRVRIEGVGRRDGLRRIAGAASHTAVRQTMGIAIDG